MRVLLCKELLKNSKVKDTNSKERKLIIEELDNYIKIYYNKPKIGRPPKPILMNKKLRLDESLAEFIGLIEAEGDHDLNKKNGFQFANTDKKIIKLFLSCIFKIFEEPTTSYFLLIPENLKYKKRIILSEWGDDISKDKIKVIFDNRRRKPAMLIFISGILYPRIISIVKDYAFKHEISTSKKLFNHYLKGKFLGDGHFYFSKLKYPVFTISYHINESDIAERDNFLINKFYNFKLSKQKSGSKNCFLLRTYNILDILKISANLKMKEIPYSKILNLIHKNFNSLYINLDDKIRYNLLKKIKEISKINNLSYWTVSSWKYGYNKIPINILLDILKKDKANINKIKRNINLIQMERKGSLEIKDSFDRYLLDEILFKEE